MDSHVTSPTKSLESTRIMDSADDESGSDTFRSVSFIRGSVPRIDEQILDQLHRRLRFVATGFAVILGYFALLRLLNPEHKVAFSLGRGAPVAVNWLVFGVCTFLAAVLWARSFIRSRMLRWIEAILFGLMLIKIALDFATDLFVDLELDEPFTQGDHALFHYGSSWSLPFAILILSYGAIIPSTWKRCVTMVALLAAVPMALSLGAGIGMGYFLKPGFSQSFFVPMGMWLAGAAGIAIFSAHRIELLQGEVIEARRLGQYVLKKRLGKGGMGEVYLAEHSLLRRPCAVKLIRPHLAGDPAAQRRFHREVHITATLTNPHTVQIFDYGRTREGTFYYVMEYLAGCNLYECVRDSGPLTPAATVRMLIQICGALHEAHQKGLIHRDIKPGNIMLCELGGVSNVSKLLDFGLAGAYMPVRGLQNSLPFAGSPQYMSPEHISGHSALDVRSDIYSLGAVAWFVLTSKPPFDRESVSQTLFAHVYEPIESLKDVRNDIPSDLHDIIMRCLEKNPAHRFRDAQQLALALQACETGSSGTSIASS